MLNALHMGWVEYCAALATARRMAADMDGRTLVVHNGDVSYAEGFVYGWDVFMHMMAPIIQRAPYMLTPGKLSHILLEESSWLMMPRAMLVFQCASRLW